MAFDLHLIEWFNDVVELKWDEVLDYDAKGYEMYCDIVDQSELEQIANLRNPKQTFTVNR